MSLAKILENHIKNIEALIECSQREREAIIYNRIQEMTDIAFEKSGLLKYSAELESEREKICMEITGSPYTAQTTMQDVLARLPEELRPHLSSLRSILMEKSAQLQRETEINTALMRDQLEYARFMLSLMCNSARKDFYSANGEKRASEGVILNRKG